MDLTTATELQTLGFVRVTSTAPNPIDGDAQTVYQLTGPLFAHSNQKLVHKRSFKQVTDGKAPHPNNARGDWLASARGSLTAAWHRLNTV